MDVNPTVTDVYPVELCGFLTVYKVSNPLKSQILVPCPWFPSPGKSCDDVAKRSLLTGLHVLSGLPVNPARPTGGVSQDDVRTPS